MSQDKYHYKKPTGPIIQADKKGRLAVVLCRTVYCTSRVARIPPGKGAFHLNLCKIVCIPLQ